MNGKVVENVIKVSLSIHMIFLYSGNYTNRINKMTIKGKGNKTKKYLALAREHYHRNINTNSIAMVN